MSMRSEWEPDPSSDSWRGLFTKERLWVLPEKATDDPFERAVDAVLAEMRATMLKKQADYGPNNIARAPGGPINGLRVRMFDKLSRISNLHDSGNAAENEPLRDSFLDVANYGLIGLMVLDGTWPNLEDK